VLSVETLIFSKLIVARRRSVVVVDISTTGAKLSLRIERAQFSARHQVEPQDLFYTIVKYRPNYAYTKEVR
jgi:hypothetical protein